MADSRIVELSVFLARFRNMLAEPEINEIERNMDELKKLIEGVGNTLGKTEKLPGNSDTSGTIRNAEKP
jgi:hypothetical protein